MPRFETKAPDHVLFREDQAPFGRVLIGQTTDGALCLVGFADNYIKASGFADNYIKAGGFAEDNAPKQVLAAWQKKWPRTRFTEERGIPSPFAQHAKPDLLFIGTPFQHKVWKALMALSAGETISYGELARRIGSPKAARAVGMALGANPLPIFAPCHRIIAANGTIGGFSGGLATKKRLLAREGVVVAER